MRNTLLIAHVVLLLFVQTAIAQNATKPSIVQEGHRGSGVDVTASQLSHLKQAIRHLEAAGLSELVEQVRTHIARIAHLDRLAKKRQQLAIWLERTAQLQAEIEELENQFQAGGEQQQILVELRVLEISLNKLREQGIQVGESGLAAMLENKSSVGSGESEFFKGVVKRDTSFTNTLEALEEAGLVKTLAEPALITVSGRPASFRSGGALPILVPQNGGEVVVEYREFGTRVDLVPRHMGNGRIRLEIRPEISEIVPERSVMVHGTKVPGIRIRMVDTAAELSDGETLAILGTTEIIKAPKGAADEAPAADGEEIELIVLATPRLIKGRPPQKVPATAKRSARDSHREAARPRSDATSR